MEEKEVSRVEYDLTDFSQRQERERDRQFQLAMRKHNLRMAKARNEKYQLERSARFFAFLVFLAFIGVVSCTAMRHDPANEQYKDQIEKEREAFCIEKGYDWVPASWGDHAAYCSKPDE